MEISIAITESKKQTYITQIEDRKKKHIKNNWPVKKDFAYIGSLNKFYKSI